MTPITLPETHMLYRRRIGAYGKDNALLMADFKNWLKASNLIADDTIILALIWDNPDLTPPENCRYDVALVVKPEERFEAETLEQTSLTGGKFMAFTIPHTQAAIAETMQTMIPDLLAAGHSYDVSRPIIERYAMQLLDQDLCEILVPIL